MFHTSLTMIHTQPPSLAASPQNAAFVKICEPTLINHNHTKSIIYTRVYSWCCVFYKFRQTHNNVYSVQTENLHCAKKSPVLLLFILLSPLPQKSLLSLWPPQFACSRTSHSWNQTVWSFSHWLLLLRNMHLSFLHVCSWPYGLFLFNTE